MPPDVPPEPQAPPELLLLVDQVELCLSHHDIEGALDALRQFHLVLRQRSADDLTEGAARALHARAGVLLDRLLEARDRVMNELHVLRRTRGYGSEDPATGRWIEDRA